LRIRPPAPSKHKLTTSAIIKRGIFSPGCTPSLVPRYSPIPVQQQQPVHRGPLPWAQPPAAQAGLPRASRPAAAAIIRRCFAPDQEECAPPPPPPPLRRRAVVRAKPDLTAYFRIRASDNGDTSALLKDDFPDADMDRLNKFRFGGRGKSAADEEAGDARPAGTAMQPKNLPHKKKAPRTTDKSERLRQLTERLKGSPAPPAGTPGRPAAPDAASTAAAEAPKEDDLFEGEQLRLCRPESRAIVGSYIQRTIPFRSASFSQVDFSPDGKYVRSSPESPEAGRADSSSGSATLPRKRVPNTQGASPATPSEPAVPEAAKTAAKTASPHHKAVGSRSMTHPLPAQTRIADIPYSSIDSNGLESLKIADDPKQSVPKDVAEQNMPNHVHSDSEHCDEVKSSPAVQCPDTQQNVSYEVFVKQFPNYKEYERWMSEDVVRDKSKAQSESAPRLEHDSSCINNFDPTNCPKCLEQMSHSTSILERLKHSIDGEESTPERRECSSPPPPPPLPPPVKAALFERSKSEPRVNAGEPAFVPPQWSTTAEPVSPEEAPARPPEWPTVVKRGTRTRRWLERPKLICQSSDERDDDGSSPVRHPRRLQLLTRSDSQSEDSDHTSIGTPQRTASPIELSDSEGLTGGSSGSGRIAPETGSSLRSPHAPRRYSKRPLRGPYGQMLEAEMKKPDSNRNKYNEELKFLHEYGDAGAPQNKGSSQSLIVAGEPHPSTELSRSASTGESAKVPGGCSAARASARGRAAGSRPEDPPSPLRRTASVSTKADLPKWKVNVVLTGPPVCHQRTTSSPSQLEGIALKAEQQLSNEAFRRAAVKSPPPCTNRRSPQEAIKTLSAEGIADILSGAATQLVKVSSNLI